MGCPWIFVHYREFSAQKLWMSDGFSIEVSFALRRWYGTEVFFSALLFSTLLACEDLVICQSYPPEPRAASVVRVQER